IIHQVHGSCAGNLFDDHSAEPSGTNRFNEPPLQPGDTPASSVEDMAWAHEQPKPDSSFDEVLNALSLDTSDATAPRNPFTDLVNSMRSGEAHRPLPSRQEQFVEFILTGGMDSLLEENEQSQSASEQLSEAPEVASSLFERLAQEEPPPPTFEESGTVSDLVTGLQDRSFRNVLSILRGEEVQESEPVLPPTPADFEVGEREEVIPPLVDQYYFDDEPTPARVILQRTLEESVSGNEFSLEELLHSIEEQFPQHRPRILPPPTWLIEEQKKLLEDSFMLREPDFLPEEVPYEATPSADLYPNQTTQPSRGQQIEAHPEALETEWLESPQPVADETVSFPTSLPEEIPADATIMHQPVAQESSGVWHNFPEQDFNTQFEMMAAFEVHDQSGMSSGALYTEVPAEAQAGAPAELPEEVILPDYEAWDHSEVPVRQPTPETPPAPSVPPVPVEDPYIAQLALSLTEASLELTAEATLLARDGQIVAYAGRMPKAEIDELRGAISNDWDAAPGEVRIRFLTARGSGKDYMLYSRRTEDDFTLSLIFAGTTPLRDIRRQGQRLVESLLAVPETPVTRVDATRGQPAVQEVAVDTAVRTPYACVWLLRDAKARFEPAAAQAIIAGLNIQMREKHWNIHNLQVRDDFVYLFADIPGEEVAFKIVRDLKRRAAEIAHAQNPANSPDSLWSDGYLVVTPGRELDAEEIQQFITFERMG
ncbi:MAG: transposase, partial [Chloroflexota bacterium]